MAQLPMMLLVSVGAEVMNRRAALPIVPLALKRMVDAASERLREAMVTSSELTLVPPVVVRSVLLPPARVTAPIVSVVAPWWRPVITIEAPVRVIGAVSLMRLLLL